MQPWIKREHKTDLRICVVTMVIIFSTHGKKRKNDAQGSEYGHDFLLNM